MKKLIVPVLVAVAAITGFSTPAQADCVGAQCYVSGIGMCSEPERCPICIEDIPLPVCPLDR